MKAAEKDRTLNNKNISYPACIREWGLPVT
jgi:hypothetical protein